MGLKTLAARLLRLAPGDLPAAALDAAGEANTGARGNTTEIGNRIPADVWLERMYAQFWVDPRLRQTILDIRHMDTVDPRVKKIHSRMARAAVKGGLVFEAASAPQHFHRRWKAFRDRLHLGRQPKLESDARGLVKEGNLALQWVLDESARVVGGVRMPVENLVPVTGPDGRFTDPAVAYEQRDIITNTITGRFAAWQLSVVRLDPENYDDQGCFGRPYLDSTRSIWKKLTMTEEDLVVRRRERAPLRTAHFLEGATPEELQQYQERVEGDQKYITKNFYSNRRGAVTAVQGDANLDQIKDIGLLLDAFFSGAPAPKGLFGYSEGLSRDILQDLKADFFDEIDALQDNIAAAYMAGFRLELLLAGISPDAHEWCIRFVERRTESPNQATDRAMKQQAIGASRHTVLRTAGLDPETERSRLQKEAEDRDPYPDPNNIATPPARGAPRVTVVPNNAPRRESAASITQ